MAGVGACDLQHRTGIAAGGGAHALSPFRDVVLVEIGPLSQEPPTVKLRAWLGGPSGYRIEVERLRRAIQGSDQLTRFRPDPTS